MPGSHDWRNRAASQIAQPLPDNTADALTVLNPRAVDRHMWSKGEYERALDLINRGYDKLIVAQIIGRTLAQLNNKLYYEQMEDGKRQQRRERINELASGRSAPLTGHARTSASRHRGSNSRRQACSRSAQPGRRQSIAT